MSSLGGTHLLLLGLLGGVTIGTALFDFEALRKGKIAIIEPIIGLELPLTIVLSVTLVGEKLSFWQLILMSVVFLGIMLAITARRAHFRSRRQSLERGVILAVVSAIGMALINILVGVSSQNISPVMTIWFAHSLLVVIVCGIYLICKGEFRNLITDFRRNPKLILCQSILDNIAWLSFAKATTLIPIAIATTISESYIALAVLLGLFVNHEKLKFHQIVGVVLATVGVVSLSYHS